MPLDILLHYHKEFPYIPFLSFGAMLSRFPDTYDDKTHERLTWHEWIEQTPDEEVFAWDEQ